MNKYKFFVVTKGGKMIIFESYFELFIYMKGVPSSMYKWGRV